MTVDFAVSIASLYLALVGLLSTFFAIQLGQWLTQIQATESKWNQVRDREPRINFFDRRLECYYESSSEAAPWTFVGWLVVTSFLVVIFVFEELLARQVSVDKISELRTYVFAPSYVFLVIYLVLSLVMLNIGYGKARSIRDTSRKEL